MLEIGGEDMKDCGSVVASSWRTSSSTMVNGEEVNAHVVNDRVVNYRVVDDHMVDDRLVVQPTGWWAGPMVAR